MEEIKLTLRKFKRRKAPGPDEIPMEIFKEMDEENLEEIKEILNYWWNNEKIPKEQLRARVVLIYKKGDTGKYGNYRPISLLNSIYKLFTAIIQKRLANKLDEHLQKTQYGFRKNKSTADAIHIIRRITEYGQQTNNRLHMVLLDWEKAFDKVDREGLIIALKRMKVPEKLTNIIEQIYTDTEFIVEIEGVESSWTKQETGIRQGCPLSPYLFLVVMTALFHDVHEK